MEKKNKDLKNNKQKRKLFIGFVLGVLFLFATLAVIFKVVIGTGGIQGSIREGYLNISEEAFSYCESDSDCVLVKTGWCDTVVSINEESKLKWLEEDEKYTEESKEGRYTCKLTARDYHIVENFSSSCIDDKCKASYNR